MHSTRLPPVPPAIAPAPEYEVSSFLIVQSSWSLTSFSVWRLHISLISCATFVCRQINSATFDRDPGRLDCKGSLRQLRAHILGWPPLQDCCYYWCTLLFLAWAVYHYYPTHLSYPTSSSLHPSPPPLSIRDPLTSSHILFVLLPLRGREQIGSPTMQFSPNSPPSYAWQVGRWGEHRTRTLFNMLPSDTFSMDKVSLLGDLLWLLLAYLALHFSSSAFFRTHKKLISPLRKACGKLSFGRGIRDLSGDFFPVGYR